MKRISTIAVAASVILIQAGCRDATSSAVADAPTFAVAAEPAPLVPRLIAPQATDPDIDWVPGVNPQFNQHYVWLDPSQEIQSETIRLPTRRPRQAPGLSADPARSRAPRLPRDRPRVPE